MTGSPIDKALSELSLAEGELRAVANRLDSQGHRDAARLEFALDKLGSALGVLGTMARPRDPWSVIGFSPDRENWEP